jgi:hypothetical protein
MHPSHSARSFHFCLRYFLPCHLCNRIDLVPVLLLRLGPRRSSSSDPRNRFVSFLPHVFVNSASSAEQCQTIHVKWARAAAIGYITFVQLPCHFRSLLAGLTPQLHIISKYTHRECIHSPETSKHHRDRCAVRSHTTPFVISAGNDLSFVRPLTKVNAIPSNILSVRIGKSRSLQEHYTKYAW